MNGIFYADISDLYHVFHIDYSSEIQNEETVIKKRIFSQSNLQKFSSLLGNHKWDHIVATNDAQAAYTAFLKDYIRMYDDSFPIKTFKKGYKTRKSWLSEELKMP